MQPSLTFATLDKIVESYTTPPLLFLLRRHKCVEKIKAYGGKNTFLSATLLPFCLQIKSECPNKNKMDDGGDGIFKDIT